MITPGGGEMIRERGVYRVALSGTNIVEVDRGKEVGDGSTFYRQEEGRVRSEIAHMGRCQVYRGVIGPYEYVRIPLASEKIENLLEDRKGEVGWDNRLTQGR